jgi:hypothetical protein
MLPCSKFSRAIISDEFALQQAAREAVRHKPHFLLEQVRIHGRPFTQVLLSWKAMSCYLEVFRASRVVTGVLQKPCGVVVGALSLQTVAGPAAKLNTKLLSPTAPTSFTPPLLTHHLCSSFCCYPPKADALGDLVELFKLRLVSWCCSPDS